MLRTGNGDDTIYISFDFKENISFIIFHKGLFYSLQVGSNDETVKKWAAVMKLSCEEYLCHLKSAFMEQLVPNAQGEIDNSKTTNSFDVLEECLIWKQHFPQKGIHGRKGKFSLEQVSFQTGFTKAAEMAANNMISYEKLIKDLKEENIRLKNDVEEFKGVAEENLSQKSNMEDTLYGKFAAILCEKKKYIQKLNERLNLLEEKQMPSTSSRVITSDAAGSSNEYDADTDVSDMDTDDEREKLSMKRKSLKDEEKKDLKKHKISSKGDSQDLFNDSMEADLNIGFSLPIVKKR